MSQWFWSASISQYPIIYLFKKFNTSSFVRKLPYIILFILGNLGMLWI